MANWQTPTDPFTILDIQNPSIDISGRDKICQPMDFEAKKGFAQDRLNSFEASKPKEKHFLTTCILAFDVF